MNFWKSQQTWSYTKLRTVIFFYYSLKKSRLLEFKNKSFSAVRQILSRFGYFSIYANINYELSLLPRETVTILAGFSDIVGPPAPLLTKLILAIANTEDAAQDTANSKVTTVILPHIIPFIFWLYLINCMFKKRAFYSLPLSPLSIWFSLLG